MMKNIKVLFTGLILLWSVSVGYAQCSWTPTDLGSSLKLWLDGSDAASMTQSGGLVSQWNDKSGNARHATQATSGSRPTYTASGLNGKSVLTFDGSDDNMSINAPFTNNAGTALIVYKPNSDNQYCLFTGNNDSWTIYNGNNSSYESTFRSVRLEGVATNQISINDANIFMIEASSVLPSYKMFKDGSTIYSSAAAFTFQNNINSITTNRFLNGFVCEVILIDNVLTQSNREKLEGYLAEKWGLRANLPSGHTFKSSAPTTAASVGTASSTPTLCINNALTNITHTTTNATGIGTATGLPAGVTAAWASNTITISGTPTASGTFNYSIPLTSACGSANATGTITVNAATLTAGAASSTPTLCINTALTNITHTTTSATGIGTATGLPTGVTAAWASNTITISGTPTVAGTFNYTIPLTVGCGGALGTITVNAVNTAGAASSTPTLCVNNQLTNITHTTTGATGIGTATGLPAGVTAAWASNTITISGTPTAGGTFSYTIPLTGGCGSVNATGTITVRSSSAWLPSDLGASLTMWYDASDASSITHSSGVVSQWNDKSGNARHLAESNNTYKPTYTANILNGYGGIDFNANKGLFSTSTPTVAYAATILKAANTTFGNYHAMLESRTNATRIGGLRASGNTNFWGDVNPTAAWEDGTSKSPSVAFNTINSPHIIEFTTCSGRGNPMSGVTVGNFDQVNQGGSGIQYEIIALSAAPSVADREKIEGYLAHKWGLTANLPGGHTYKSAAPTFAASAGAASSTPTLCVNTALTNITHTTTNATGIGTATGLPAGVTAAWASNTITISGTPTASGTFNYSIPLTGGCGSVSATGTIKVSAGAPTAGAASSTPTLCINTALTNITHTTTNATGIGSATGLPAGVTAAWASNTITISGTPTASGTFNYTIPLTGGCGTVNATGTITVTAVNTAGAASSTPTLCVNAAMSNITHATTGATGIGTATGLPAGVNAAWSGNVITISGTPTATGTFNYSIPLTGGCGSVNATGTITVRTNSWIPSDGGASLVLWMDAADAATITHSSGVVSQWNDKSGNARHLAQSDNALRPTYTANILNGKGGIDFYLNKGLFSTTTPVVGYIATVVKAQSATWNGYHTSLESRSGRIGGIRENGNTMFHSNVYPSLAWQDGTSISAGATFSTINSPHVIEYTPAAGTGNPVNGLTVGNYDAQASGGSGIQYEIIALSAAPSVADRERMEGYLAHKWGLTANLPSGHTYKSSAPTFTDHSVSAASSTPTLCSNTALTNITHTTTGATGIGTATGLPAGVTAAWANNTITISGTPTASGTFNYTIPLTGGFGGNVSATGSITVSTWLPSNLGASLAMWLDASDLSTITQSGGLVSQWNDKSGNARHLAESNNTYKPTYTANILNGKGGIDFNSNKGLFSTSTPTVAYAATIVKAANSTFGNYHAMLESRTNATRIGGLRASGSTIFWYDVYPTAAWEDGTSMTPSVAFNTINSPHIIEFTTSSGRGNPMSGVTVGNFDQVNQGGSGIQYEIIALSSVPSVADREKIEGYLAHKWGLAANLPSGHTYKSSPPSITAGAASSTPTLNINTALTNITHTTSGATGISNSGVSGGNGLPAGVSATWAANVITISGTPTASGTFVYSIPLTGGCGINATGTITVLAANAVGAASSTPTLCINTALTNITHTTTGATGIANSGVSGGNGLPAGVSAAWTGNVITISGTPTASGTFSYSILLTGGFGGSVSATGTITVTAANTAGTASSTPTLCINTALTNITRTTTGATGIGTATGLPAGVSATWAGNVITISGTPTASGTFSYSIPLTGGCGTVNATGTITVSPVTVGGSLSGTATVCPGSNSGTLTLSGHTGSVVRWESSLASNFASPTTISSTATSYTYTNLSSVTYYRVVVQSGTCSSSNSSTATITFSEAVDGGRIEW